MEAGNGHILSEDIVVNYSKTDKDNCIHFITHLRTDMKNISDVVSSSAKRIFTSHFNKWYLTANFLVEKQNIYSFDLNISYKVTFNNQKFIFSFLDSKATSGSVALLLHGKFGSYLYTGPFCFYRAFLNLPPMLPVIKKKVLTKLYYGGTHHEQQSSCKNFDDNIKAIVNLIGYFYDRTIVIVSESISTHSIVAEIALQVKEKIHAEKSELEIMEKLGHGSLFNNNHEKSRIIMKTCWQESDLGNIRSTWIILNWHHDLRNESSIRQNNLYIFNFCAHSTKSDSSLLMSVLEPTEVIYIYTESTSSNLFMSLNIQHNNARINEALSNKDNLYIQDDPQTGLLKNNSLDFDKNVIYKKTRKRKNEQIEISPFLEVNSKGNCKIGNSSLNNKNLPLRDNGFTVLSLLKVRHKPVLSIQRGKKVMVEKEVASFKNNQNSSYKEFIESECDTTEVSSPKCSSSFYENIDMEEDCDFQNNSPKTTDSASKPISSHKKSSFQHEIQPVLEKSINVPNFDIRNVDGNVNMNCSLNNVPGEIIDEICFNNNKPNKKLEIDEFISTAIYRRNTHAGHNNIENTVTMELPFARLRKVLRSEVAFITHEKQHQKNKKVNYTCSVLLTGIPKNYYYCKKQVCYLPGFLGFKRSELLYKFTSKKIMTRRRILKKLINQ